MERRRTPQEVVENGNGMIDLIKDGGCFVREARSGAGPLATLRDAPSFVENRFVASAANDDPNLILDIGGQKTAEVAHVEVATPGSLAEDTTAKMILPWITITPRVA